MLATKGRTEALDDPAQRHPFEPSRPPADRYGEGQLWEPPRWNATLDLLFAHHSVRRWLDRDSDGAALRTILAAAQSGPSSSNQQVASVVVRSADLKAQLAEVAGAQQRAHILAAPVVLVWLIDYARARRLAAERGSDIGTIEYLDAALVGETDIGIAAQNAVTAAESLGLGTVFLGSLRNDAERVAAIRGLPEGVVPFFGLEIGHPDPSAPAGQDYARAAQLLRRLAPSALTAT